MAVKEASAARPSARERLLAAANELFYNEGVHTVGIDRVIEQAGVAKASLYKIFGSKDELVRADLEARHASVAQRITRAVDRYHTPRERLLAVFEGQGELFAQPGTAAARSPGPARNPIPATWSSRPPRPPPLGARAADRAGRPAGAPKPEALARQLHRSYDGSGQAARMDHDHAVAAAAAPPPPPSSTPPCSTRPRPPRTLPAAAADRSASDLAAGRQPAPQASCAGRRGPRWWCR